MSGASSPRGERSVAWVLNLDADLELAAGRAYAPSKAALVAMAPYGATLARALVRPGDVVLPSDQALRTPIADAGALCGLAFCPTPRAVALLRAAGVEPSPHPPLEVLRRVNGRAFSAELGQTLPGAVFVTSVAEAMRVVAAAPPVGRQWRAKRAFGMAGRGQRPIAVGALSPADADFLRASVARDGGVQIEPDVAIARELALHGVLFADGTMALGRLVEQRCDASGQWQGSVPIGAAEDCAPLRDEAARVGRALHAAGYFGPFGIDAFEYDDGGRVVLNPRSEINARYSMGWPASGLDPHSH